MQDYEITAVQEGSEWQNDYGTFQGFNLVLKGHGEPVLLNKKVPVTDPPKEGDTIYGSIEMKTSKNGKDYWTFKAAQKQPEAPRASSGHWQESPEKQDSINKAVALNNAVVLVAARELIAPQVETVTDIADHFYAWLKGEKVERVEIEEPLDRVTAKVKQQVEATGYAKAKAKADELKKHKPSDNEMPEDFLK